MFTSDLCVFPRSVFGNPVWFFCGLRIHNLQFQWLGHCKRSKTNEIQKQLTISWINTCSQAPVPHSALPFPLPICLSDVGNAEWTVHELSVLINGQSRTGAVLLDNWMVLVPGMLKVPFPCQLDFTNWKWKKIIKEFCKSLVYKGLSWGLLCVYLLSIWPIINF